MANRFAVTVDDAEMSREVDYSLTSVLVESREPTFDPVKNLEVVLENITQPNSESDELLYAAAQAIQRNKSNSHQNVDTWAESLSLTFFTDLENKSS